MKVIVFGHVDTGKSTLCGQILVNTVDEYKQIYQQRKDIDKKILSNLLDIYEEEQVRCKTSEFSSFDVEYGKNSYTFIDTPGHKIYIRQYIEALQQHNLTCGLLILSAHGNEFESGFEKGTTKEYITLAKCMGVKNLIVAINKMDMVNYDKTRYEDIKTKISNYIPIFKFKKVEYISTSGTNNVGIFDTNGLFDILSKYNEITEKVHTICSSLGIVDTVNIKLQIFECKNIITSGFSCIAHFISENEPVEAEVMVENIIGKVFAKKGEIVETVCKFKYPFAINLNTKILFRTSDITIGCGIVYK